jgi:hypothetical protein
MCKILGAGGRRKGAGGVQKRGPAQERSAATDCSPTSKPPGQLGVEYFFGFFWFFFLFLFFIVF